MKVNQIFEIMDGKDALMNAQGNKTTELPSRKVSR
jgi:hypothetical protein